MILLWAVLLVLTGCEYLPFMAARNPPPPRPSATATPTATPTPTPTATPEVRKPRRHKRQTRSSAPTPVTAATPASGAVITTGESVSERNEIERSIVRVEGRLATIKRGQLNAQDGADYKRIQSFVADARAALQEQDDLRARSLVEKASRLVAQLAGRVSSP